MSFGRIIHFNPLNRHYLYPPFFSNTRAKDEKRPFFGTLTTSVGKGMLGVLCLFIFLLRRYQGIFSDKNQLSEIFPQVSLYIGHNAPGLHVLFLNLKSNNGKTRLDSTFLLVD